MESIIKELRKKPFSGHDILTALDNKTKILTYPQLYKYKSLDSLLKPYGCVVILYETKPAYGHWVCIIKHPNNTVEFFDSLGYFIDDELDIISMEFRKKNKEIYPYLTKLMLESGYKIIYNPIILQKDKNDISTCGRHVTLRLVLKDLSLNKYIKLITSDKNYDPDSLVTYLTAFV